MKQSISLILSGILALAACSAPQVKPLDRNPLQSPDGTLELRADVVDGVPMYSLRHGQSDVILPSRLGYDLVGDIDLKDGFKLDDVSYSSFDETWTPVWGEEDHIRNRYNEMLLKLSREDGVRMNIRFRLYNDGLGFRYEFPMENKLTYFKVADELTEFALAGDHTAWWISGDYDTQEYNYYKSRLSEIRGINGADRPYNASQSYIGPTAVQTALQMKTDEGLYINLHEARVLDYSTTSLLLDDKKMVFRTALTPDAQGIKARLQAPCVSPWRTVQVCEKATDVLASRLILNLNDPCVLEDVSWIHPVKYMGVWWEMITGKTHWSYTSDFPSVKLGETDYSKAKPHGRHGANNENVRRYIDFAAANGFDALLIEGWNEGWEDWFGCQKEFVFDFITPYPDFDLPALNEYAHSKGMRLIMHHESSSSTVNYERWMEQAYTLMNQYGYDAVKSGYVGDIIPFGEHHYSQPESAMGNEFRMDINPGHTCILPFTRLQGGPMDFTPGIFEQDMSITAPGETGKMRHTIGNQLGLYVTFYSPLQMAADLPENYARFMDAFQFIKDVAVDWDKSLYLEAEPGEYIVTARHPKLSTLNAGRLSGTSGAYDFVYAGGRPHDVWYVGGVCGENAHETTFKLDFLKPGVSYEATLYADAPDADYETNPQAYTITHSTVTSADVLTVRMARSGGFGLSLREGEALGHCPQDGCRSQNREGISRAGGPGGPSAQAAGLSAVLPAQRGVHRL